MKRKFKNISREILSALYKKGLSMQEIANKTGWSYNKVVYWMKKFGIKRRSLSEAIYLKWNRNGDPFKLKKNLTKKEMELKGLGLGLYWGEGDKNLENGAVRLSNTDPYVIKKFKEFLTRICGVNEEKFLYSLTLFNNANEKEAVDFWTKALGIKREKLGKITKIPPQGKGTYKRKNKFGVLMLTVNNKKLKLELFKMIKEICMPG